MGSKNRNKNKNKSKSKKKDDDKDQITDSRFASVHWDPIFRNDRKDKVKTVIDDRFKSVFTDPRFKPTKAPVNKRGKPKDPNSAADPLREFYRLQDDDDDDLDHVKYDKVEQEDSDEDDDEEEEEEEEDEGNLVNSESESEELEEAEAESDTTGSDTDEDYEDGDDEVILEDGMPSMQTENIPEIDKETNRLAVVNLDWRYIKSVDLLVVLRSFLPKGGEIKSVAVYPSEFGIQRMKEEEVHGPVGLFDDKDKKGDEESDSDEEEEDEDVINQKMRAYEKSRLRYYYAVVVCDSVNTADYLYRNCDGVEFERSSNTLDLRFIPDSLEINHPARDIATEVPSSYVGLDFQTRALQHSKIDISWDDDEPARRTLKRKFTADQLDENDLKEYLASDESESEAEAEAEEENEDEDEDDTDVKPDKKSRRIDKYRSLILSGNGDASDEDGEKGGQDMEVTFNTRLEDLSKRILEKKDRESETVWETHLRKKREKKKAMRNKSKDSSEDESSDPDGEAPEEPDDFFIEEPPVKKTKKEPRGKSNKEEKQHQDMDEGAEATKNELELLLADDKGTDTGIKGYNLKRKKKIKGKKGKEVPEEDKIPAAVLEDPRFANMFTSPLFALDPTDPQFKRSATYAREVALRQQKNVVDTEEEVPEMKEVKVQSDELSSKIEKSSLIRSIKMKAKPFEGKMPMEDETFPIIQERKVEQEPATSVKSVKKKKAKVGRK